MVHKYRAASSAQRLDTQQTDRDGTVGRRRQTAPATMSRKMNFFEFWRTKKERGELLKRTNQMRLCPSQLARLLSDSGVRAELQNTRMASLLPPVGTEVFRRLTPASLVEIQRRHEAEEGEQEMMKNKKVADNDLPKPASELEAGKPLPFFYGSPPPELLSTPLEELDPFYQSQKTFIVLGKGNITHRFNAEPVCYLLSPFSLMRTTAIKILIHSLFSLFMTATILTNCVFMTMSDPPAWSQTARYIFIAIYTFEAIIKVVARGFCIGKFTFLRDPWNWLDVMVISTGCLMEFVDFGKFSVLMTVPRVLKLVPLLPGLKTTVGSLFQSLRRLAYVIVLTLFGLSLLALIALQLFMGDLRQKCVANFTNITNFTNFHEYINNPVNQYFMPGHLDALLCGNSSDSGDCPDGYTCLRVKRSMNYGYTNYDTFGWALLSMLRLMSQDFWENLMLITLRAAGKTYLIFFVAVVFPTCFCLLSLIAAVVAMASGEQEEAGVAELRQREEEFSQILEVMKREEENPNPSGSDKDGSSCPLCWFVLPNFLLKCNCCGCWRRLKQLLDAVITNPFFDFGVVVCLVLNILFMSMEHFPMTYKFEEMLSIAHMVFTLIFTAEMVFKLVAMDPYGYFKVGWNIFDSIIVALSLMGLFVYSLRGLVVLRVLRLARWWPSLRMLMKVIWTAVSALRNLTLILLIVVFVFSVVGMQLFQQDYKDNVCRISMDCLPPRWHMNDFFHTFLIIIRVLCGEWIEVLWDCMEVSGQTTCLIFFILFLVIGNLLVLNLFLTLLLSSFSSDRLDTPQESEKNNLHLAISQIYRAVGALLGKKTHVNPDHTGVDSKEVNRKDYLALTSVTSSEPVSEVKALSSDHNNPTSNFHAIDSQGVPIAGDVMKPGNAEKEKKEDDEDQKGDPPEDCCSDKCYRCCPFLDIDTSQGKGRVWSNFRRACVSIVQHKCFEIFIIVIILLSSTALVFEDVHLQHRHILKTVVETADRVFIVVFLIEMVLKWIAFGLKKYFTDAWCWLDFLILQVSLVPLVFNTFGFADLGAMQSLRALGPLRALSRFQGVRVVVCTLVRTGPSMVNVLLVGLTVWLVFCIEGVNLFAGKFSYCFNETSEERFLPGTVMNQTDCLSLVRGDFPEVRWKSLDSNYDNVLNGYLSLLHLGFSAGSFDIMYAAVDATWVMSQPVYENNPYMYFYFIVFTIMSAFFTTNLFIRVIIDKLQRDKIRKQIFMTEEQQKQCKAFKIRVIKPSEPVPRPQNRCQAWLFDLVTKRSFRVAMAVVICLNILTLMVETDQQSFLMEEILHWFNFSFIIVFLLEFMVKLIALRKHYFTDCWNILDLTVLIATIVGLFIADLLWKYFFTVSFFVVLRVVHIGRLLFWVRGFRKLFFAIMMSLPALFNIGLILFIIMFTSSIFGMFNFAYVKKEYLIDDMFNFETFANSFINVLMITTSSSWDGLLNPIRSTPPDCDPYLENPGFTVRGNCGSPAVGIAFFTTHLILSFLLVVLLYIAVILESFNSEDAKPLSDHDFQMFQKTWRKFDPEASQFIQYSELSDFCNALQDPLRIPKPNAIKRIHMDLPLLPGDKIHYVDVLLAVSTQVSGDSGEMNSLKSRMEEKFIANPSEVSCEPISSPLQRKQEDVAATVIHGDDEDTAVEFVAAGGGV